MTKSRKTTIRLLICVLAVMLLATVLVACNNNNNVDHYDYLVTFVYNKGNLTGNTPTQYLGVMKNSLVTIRPGYSTDISEGVVNGYYVEGWYLPAEFDEEGNPVKDENGFVLLGDKWDFQNQRVNENITLYAKFKKKTVIQFVDINSLEPVPGTSGRIERIPGEKAYKPSTSPSKDGWTFLGKYYADTDKKDEFKWPYTAGEEDINVYVEYLEGEWALVSDAYGFVSAMRSNSNIYLLDNIDLSTYNEASLWSPSVYTGELNGRNYKISGVKRSITAARNNSENFGAIFGKLGAKAYVHDVRFEGIELEFRVNSSYSSVSAYVGLIAGNAEVGARLENVTVTGSLSYLPNSNKEIYVEKLVGDGKATIINCDASQVEVGAIE